MISYPASLKAVGGARSGVAPVHLLDVEDMNGNLYFWSDRRCEAPAAIGGGVEVAADPPVAPADGQYVTWSLPTAAATNTQDAGASNGSATATVSGTAKLIMTSSGGLSNWWFGAYWSSFAAPSLPLGARIDAIYPVVMAQSEGSPASAFCGHNLTITALDPGGESLGLPSTEFDGQYSGASIGSSLDALTNLTLGARVTQTVSSDAYRELDISFVGLAIYYSLPSVNGGSGIYSPWLLDVPQFNFHRSLQTDTGSFVIQNLSGDTLSRDTEKILRASTLEGALFVYRLWQADAEAAWLEVHGTLTMDPTSTRDLTLKGSSLINPSQDDTPLENYCETCQIDWAGRRCGSTQATECQYSFQTCQVVERIMVVLNNYEKNFGAANASTAQKVINRRRKI